MLAFYVEVLGLRVISDATATPAMSACFGAAPDGFRIIRLEARNGDRLKLVAPHGVPLEGQAPGAWVFGRAGLAYLTFIVAGIEDVVARLRRHNIPLVTPAPVPVRPGFVALFVHDPEGNAVEFVEYENLASYRPPAHRPPL